MAVTPQSLAVLRRQLEGRWELLERARENYTTLSRQLSSLRWKHHLRDQPELLTETREQETELDEVLTYVEQRAGREEWPREHPGLGVLHGLRAQRAKLEALVRKRLARSSPRGGASFAELLGELETRVLASVPSPPRPGDPVLVEGRHGSWLVPGHFWLTPERLLWKPWLGEPSQVMLASLPPGSVSLMPGSLGVRVEGVEGYVPATPARSRSLMALLERCRRLPHSRDEQPQVRDVVTHTAYLHEEDYESEALWGMSVFRPGYVAFLPARRPSILERFGQLLGTAVRRPPPSELQSLERLVEELRRLPSAEFNKCLRDLVQVRGGAFWPASDTHRAPDSEKDIQLQSGGRVLVVPGTAQQGELQLLLQRQRLEDPPPDAGRGSWWRRHTAVKVGTLLGLGMQFLPVLMLRGYNPSVLGTLLNLAGHGLFAWACMRYTKAKGHPAALGLVLALICGPGMLFVVFSTKKKKVKRQDPSLRAEAPR